MLLKFSNGKYSSINGSWTNLVAFESHYGGNNKQQRRQIIISLVMSFPLQTITLEGAVCKMTQRNEQGLRALYIISLETLSLRRVKKLPYYYFSTPSPLITYVMLAFIFCIAIDMPSIEIIVSRPNIRSSFRALLGLYTTNLEQFAAFGSLYSFDPVRNKSLSTVLKIIGLDVSNKQQSKVTAVLQVHVGYNDVIKFS